MTSKTIETQEQLEERMSALGYLDDGTRRHVICSLIGHSRYITSFFGYQYCGRCSDQIGDALASVGRDGVVTAEHLAWGDCDECEKARPSLTWRDTYLLTEEAAKVEYATRAESDAAIRAAGESLSRKAKEGVL
jgi:hypothetical protein